MVTCAPVAVLNDAAASRVAFSQGSPAQRSRFSWTPLKFCVKALVAAIVADCALTIGEAARLDSRLTNKIAVTKTRWRHGRTRFMIFSFPKYKLKVETEPQWRLSILLSLDPMALSCQARIRV